MKEVKSVRTAEHQAAIPDREPGPLVELASLQSILFMIVPAMDPYIFIREGVGQMVSPGETIWIRERPLVVLTQSWCWLSSWMLLSVLSGNPLSVLKP